MSVNAPPAPQIPLGEIMAPTLGSIDASKFRDEIFDLYSIPAFDIGESTLLSGRDIGSTKQTVASGDVLLSKIVPHIRRSWVVGPSRGRRIIASGEWIVFRHTRVDPRYLRHVLISDSFHASFMATVSGVGGSLLRARPAHVANIRIPLPPLAEQRRIAHILDRVDALRAKRRSGLERLEAMTLSLFDETFGDPAANPKGWDVGVLGDVSIRITDGEHLNPTFSSAGMPIVMAANVLEDRVDLQGAKMVDPAQG